MGLDGHGLTGIGTFEVLLANGLCWSAKGLVSQLAKRVEVLLANGLESQLAKRVEVLLANRG